MDPEEEFLDQHPLKEMNPSLQELLLASLESRHYAAFKSFMKKALKKHQPKLNVDQVFPYPYEKTFFDIACSEGLKEFVEFLLELGANPNRINETHSRAPLHFAVENDHVEVLQILLKNPVINPNLEAGRQTALHMAVKKEDSKFVETLLNAGARPDIPNSKYSIQFNSQFLTSSSFPQAE